MDQTIKELVRTSLASHEPIPIPDIVPYPTRIDTAVLVPLVVDPSPTAILVVRDKKLRYHGGEVGFPGGKPEESDPSLAATALREAKEEIGLPSNTVDILGSLSPMPVATSRYRIHPFVGWVEHPPTWRLSGEVERVLSLSLQALASGDIAHQTMELTWAGRQIQAPIFVLDDQTRLYGASAFILVELMMVVGPSFGLSLPKPQVM